MANLQVKNLPDELYAQAKERAASEGVTLSDLVVRVLRRELERPTLQAWATDQRAALARQPTRSFDVEVLLDEVRGERTE